jgi:mannose-6-phosphate isomerase-like protein (cupin superfamily)
MKSYASIVLVLLSINSLKAQYNVGDLLPEVFKENVTVQNICSDQHQSTYVIWVSDSVKPHYHESHTESIYVLEGEGDFYIADSVMHIKPGDYVLIPQGAIHSYKHTSGKRSKVISIQTPEFFGKDRIWVEKQE